MEVKSTMIKMIALFKRPQDVEAFDRHYSETHAPLMRQVPGLLDMEVIRDLKSFGGEPAFYTMAIMTFKDRESFEAAMASPENRAAGKDLMSFARDYVTLVYGEVEEQK
jgi:uncharacterized protein (TIGR02118 family)